MIKSNRNIVKSIFQHFNLSDKRLESASYTFTKYERGYCKKNLEGMNIFLNFRVLPCFFLKNPTEIMYHRVYLIFYAFQLKPDVVV